MAGGGGHPQLAGLALQPLHRLERAEHLLVGAGGRAGPRFAWLAQLYTEETSESSDSDTEQEDTDPHRVVIGIESWV